MQAIQHVLTLAIDAIAIFGFGGIYLHFLYTQHTRWMQEHCPAIEPHRDNACLLRPACVLTCALPESDAAAQISGLAKKLVTEAIPATDAALTELKTIAPKRTRTRKPKTEAAPKTSTSARKPRSKKASLISD